MNLYNLWNKIYSLKSFHYFLNLFSEFSIERIINETSRSGNMLTQTSYVIPSDSESDKAFRVALS